MTGWANSPKVQVSITIDTSIDARIIDSEIKVTPTTCESCPDTGTSSPGSPSTPGGTQEKPREEKPKPTRRPKRVGQRALEDIDGIGGAYAARLREWGIPDLGSLAEMTITEPLEGISIEMLEEWRSMADWLATFAELDGDDAQILVEGLGMTDTDHLDIDPLPSEADAAAAVGRIQTPEEYEPSRILGLIEACRFRVL